MNLKQLIFLSLFSSSSVFAQTSSCPSGYTLVPANPDVGVSDDFCVMQFEAKSDGNGNPISQSDSPPWTAISQIDAKIACQGLNSENDSGEYDLISNPEWMAIARNLESNPVNWTTGIVGQGCMIRGNVGALGICNGVLTGYNGADPEWGTRLYNGMAGRPLTNGNIVWDIAGNVNEWVDWTRDLNNPDIPLSQKAYYSGDGGPIDDYQELNFFNHFSALMPAESLLPATKGINSTHGAGKVYIGNKTSTLRRGGRWGHSSTAGYFSALGNHSGTYPIGYPHYDTGFRCVYRPEPLVCPEDYLYIDGNESLGTEDFCVMKFEARVENGKAIPNNQDSTEAPTGLISPLDAKSACSANGPKFDIIANPEWMTIARKIETLDENWSGGSVGSGCLFRGNSGFNDSCSYKGDSFTIPEFGANRNTKARLAVEANMYIWDFSGNAGEWVDWSITSGSSSMTPAPVGCSSPETWGQLETIISCSSLSEKDGMPLNPLGLSNYGDSYGLGRVNLSTDPVNISYALRGGYLIGTTVNGIYSLTFENSIEDQHHQFGFRCVKRK